MTLAMHRVSRLETAALGMHKSETEKKAQHTSIVWHFNKQGQEGPAHMDAAVPLCRANSSLSFLSFLQ